MWWRSRWSRASRCWHRCADRRDDDELSVGRYPGTFQHVAAELNPEGTDYLLLPDAPPDAAIAPALETLRQLLGNSPAPLTRQEILDRWPGVSSRRVPIRSGVP